MNLTCVNQILDPYCHCRWTRPCIPNNVSGASTDITDSGLVCVRGECAHASCSRRQFEKPDMGEWREGLPDESGRTKGGGCRLVDVDWWEVGSQSNQNNLAWCANDNIQD